MSDTHAKPKSAGQMPVTIELAELLDDQIRAASIAEVVLFEFADGIRATAPGKPGQINAIVNAVVVEGHQILAFNRVPEAHLISDPMVEPRQYALAVHALWGCRQPQKNPWPQRRDDLAITVRGDMVGLIENNIVPVICTLGFE